jgi:hypothetical protein
MVSSAVKVSVRVNIFRFMTGVPASYHPAELPPERDSGRKMLTCFIERTRVMLDFLSN